MGAGHVTGRRNGRASWRVSRVRRAVGAAGLTLAITGGAIAAPTWVIAGSTAPGFTAAGELAVPRSGHAAGLLADGRVLVVGGFRVEPHATLPTPVSVVEAWQPASGRAATAGDLVDVRDAPSITILPDGRVLVVGGSAPFEVDSIEAPEAPRRAEVFDSMTGLSSPSGELAAPRRFHAAVALSDGRVLVIGGADPARAGSATTAEAWDPATGTFSPSGRLSAGRLEPSATLLPDGRVLVLGGYSPPPEGGGWGTLLPSAEAWDPATGRSSPAGTLAEARVWHTATLLGDGRVLVIGGSSVGADGVSPRASAEIWDPETATFSPAGTLATARASHTATLLPDGRVLVVGGTGPTADGSARLASAELWDPLTATFSPAGDLAEGRDGHSATLLADGRVVVLGGSGAKDGATLASAEVWADRGAGP
jgi:hypothetical protein